MSPVGPVREPRGEAGPTPPRLLTVEEVRAELNIGRSLAYQLIWSGSLPVVRIGHALRVRRADLDAYLEASRSCGSAPLRSGTMTSPAVPDRGRGLWGPGVP